jgi:hypothetical protein
VGTLTGVNIAVGSSSTGEFSTTASGGSDGCSGTSVTPAGSCTVYVVFTPSATGLRSGSVTFPVTYADSTTAARTATLSGNGIASSSSVEVTPAGIQFGNLIVGTGSENYANTVQLTNTGSAPVIVGSDSVTGAFAIYADSCASSTVLPGGTCYLYVYFNPAAAGPASGTLTIADTPRAVRTPSRCPASAFPQASRLFFRKPLWRSAISPPAPPVRRMRFTSRIREARA